MKSIQARVEGGIEKLVSRFKSLPYAFYREVDTHCFLYSELKDTGLMKGIRTHRGFRTTLLHKEYPTRGRYSEVDRILEVNMSGTRGRYDISVLDPKEVEQIDSRDFRISGEPLSPLVVVEIGWDTYYVTHVKNDLLKITDRRNGVKSGYVLAFFRDVTFPNRMGEDGYLERVKKECSTKEANRGIPIRFISVRTDKGEVSEIRDLTILGGKVVEEVNS